MSEPLNGIRVLDLSRFVAGPFCCMLLADMGAEVIKVEKRGRGDDARELGPYANGVSLYFTQYNRNKKSITLDFRSKKGQELLRSLITKSDVLVENFRPGTLDAMGLTNETLEKLNPGLIVTSISGFGQTGPYRNRAAFDCIAQAMSGLMSLTGKKNDVPLLCGTWVADFTAALYAAFGTVVAIYHKKITGEGQRVDIALLDSLVSILATAIPLYTSNGLIQERWGNRDKISGPANAFKAKNGYVYIHAGTDPLFKRLANVMGKSSLLEDPRFNSVEDRMNNIQDIEDIVQEWVSTKTVEEIELLLVEAGIPVSKIAEIPDVVKNPQLKAREQIVYLDYPGAGKITVGGVTVKLSKTPCKVKRRPPLLGEDNEEILSVLLGLTNKQIEQLKSERII